jgi:phosphoribosyl 1,2-cyclic phosphate phosphodiesterase
MMAMELLFLGTGTSAGTPMIGCHCAVCTSTNPHDKRTRPSVVISYDNYRVLVDTTPELRLQCVNNGVDMIDAIVFTHAHADHIMGLDDVRRFNLLRQGAALDVWADPVTHEMLRVRFDYAFAEKNPAQKSSRPYLTRRFIDGPFELGSRRWIPIPLIHGDTPVLGFRIDSFAYCTDVNFIPEQSFELLKGVEVLVLDALQYKKHPTHFTVDEAVEVSRKIGARQTWFTHIAHGVAHAEGNARLPEGIRFAYDGLRVQI